MNSNNSDLNIKLKKMNDANLGKEEKLKLLKEKQIKLQEMCTTLSEHNKFKNHDINDINKLETFINDRIKSKCDNNTISTDNYFELDNKINNYETKIEDLGNKIIKLTEIVNTLSINNSNIENNFDSSAIQIEVINKIIDQKMESSMNDIKNKLDLLTRKVNSSRIIS